MLGGLLLGSCGGCDGANSQSQSQAVTDIPSPDLPGAPKIPKLAVLRPYCETKLGNIDAGSAAATAFAVKMDDQSLIVLTVFSLLSQANGLSRDVVGGEQNEMVTGVTLGSTFGEMDSVIVADKVLATQPFATGDLLAITVPKGAKDQLGAFSLAKESPAVGTQVWLSAALYAGAPPSQRQHSAVITGVDEHARLTYKFENSAISFEGTAGAPILNSAGEVVAIHLSGGLEGDSLVAFGNPTAKWLPHLQSAIGPAR